MTREEATIQALRGHIEALEEMLKAKEPCDDCISRESVKKLLREEWVKVMPMEYDPYLANVMPMLDDLPSVQPERAKGKWYHSVELGWHCSCCNKPVKNMPTDYKREAEYNFCPNCGADMREE